MLFGRYQTARTPSNSSAALASMRRRNKARRRSLTFDCLEDRRMLAVGDLDSLFGDSGAAYGFITPNEDFAYDVVRVADGSLIVSLSDQGLARFSATGQPDMSFGQDGNGLIESRVGVPRQLAARDNYFYVVGMRDFNEIGIARFLIDGTPDLGFGTDGIASVVVSQSNVVSLVPEQILFSDNGFTVGATLFLVESSFEKGATLLAQFDENGQPESGFGAAGVRIDSQTVEYSLFSDLVLWNGNYIVGVYSVLDNIYTLIAYDANGTINTEFGDEGVLTLSVSHHLYLDLLVHEDPLVADGEILSVLRLLEPGKIESTHFLLADAGPSGAPVTIYGGSGTTVIDVPAVGFGDVQWEYDSSGRAVMLHSSGLIARLTDQFVLDSGFGIDGIAATQLDRSSAFSVEPNGDIIVAGAKFVVPPGSPELPPQLDTALVRLIGSTDRDSDGIENSVDIQPTVWSNEFSDEDIGGSTTGTITNRGHQILSIVDSPEPAEGLLVSASILGGLTPATIDVVDGATGVTLTAGDQLTVSHGSVILNVIAGVVEVTFTADNGQVVAAATLAAGTGITFEPETVTFAASAASVNDDISVSLFTDTQVATAKLEPGDAVRFDPDSFVFSAPAENAGAVEVSVNGETVRVAPGTDVRPVRIEIGTHHDPDSLNLNSNSVIEVAIFSTVDFDAQQIVATSVRFAGASATQIVWRDVDQDGRLDLLLKFHTRDTNLRETYEQLVADDINSDGVFDSNHQLARVELTGETVDQVLIQGFDDLDLFLNGKALKKLLQEMAEDGLI